MPLRSARLVGDRVLEECLAGRHRMLAGERGLPVKRIQQALIDLGHPVGPSGADGIFGDGTGAAVTAYKTRRGLQPNDPVVGPGTTAALDEDLFVGLGGLDPAFAEFTPFVVSGRVEQFVALELSALHAAPLDSWRHMLGRFALASLVSGHLLGVTAQSRAVDLREQFLAVADNPQQDPEHGAVSAETFFDDAIIGGSIGNTILFTVGGQRQAFVLIDDSVILGSAVITRTSDNTRAPVTTQGAVVHELTHARNLASSETLRGVADSDGEAFADTGIAAARTAASGRRSALTMRAYVREIVARHVHWVVLQEIGGTPGTLALRGLTPDRLLAGALLYFSQLGGVYDVNGYGAAIDALGDGTRLPQLDRWLRRCADESFSDDGSADNQARLLFQAAARHALDLLVNPTNEFSEEDGLFPLIQDFH